MTDVLTHPVPAGPSPEPSRPGTTLPWGRTYAVVSPEAYKIAYAINPYMDLADQPDPVRARAQWEAMVATLRGLGARVETISPVADAPDMVYAMNLGLAVRAPTGPRVAMSRMRFEERRVETGPAAAWFASRGLEPTSLGLDAAGGHFESGDAFPYAGELLVGHGKRSDETGLRALASALDVRVRGLRIVHPSMYHLDLAFSPLDDRSALVCLDAFDDAGARAVLDLVPDPVLLDVDEALGFLANSVVVGRTVVMPSCPPRVRGELAARGFDVVVVDVDEFHKGGGSIRCMTNPLDITLGRDLDVVVGGEVLLG